MLIVTTMLTLLSAVPLVAVLLCLLLGQSSLRSAIVGVAATLTIVGFWFPMSGDTWLALAGDWAPVTIEVLLIVGGGVAFAEIGRVSGAQAAISSWLRRTLGSGVAPILAIVLGLTPMVESLTGFGIGAAMAVPLLSALGLPPVRAAILGLLGLCAVPWGSMGPGTLIAAEMSGVDYTLLGVLSAVVSLPVFMGVGLVAVFLAGAGPRRLPGVLAALASAVVLWLAVLGVNLLVGTPPAGAVAGFLALAGHLLVARLRGVGGWGFGAVRRHLLSYGVLLTGVVAATAAVRALGASDTSWHYAASPAVWLAVATVVAAASSGTRLRAIYRSTLTTWLHVAPATALFIVLGALMAGSHMSRSLAEGIAVIGPAYLFLLPFVAALGGFVTGSNSGANAMFAAPQAGVAQALGAPLPWAMAVHNTAASLAMMAAPARIELAVRIAVQGSPGHGSDGSDEPAPDAPAASAEGAERRAATDVAAVRRRVQRTIIVTVLVIVAVLGLGLGLASLF